MQGRQPNQETIKLFKDKSEDITQLFMQYSQRGIASCYERNAGNLDGFTRCGLRVAETIEEQQKGLEMRMMFAQLQLGDCLNSRDEDECRQVLRSTLDSISDNTKRQLN